MSTPSTTLSITNPPSLSLSLSLWKIFITFLISSFLYFSSSLIKITFLLNKRCSMQAPTTTSCLWWEALLFQYQISMESPQVCFFFRFGNKTSLLWSNSLYLWLSSISSLFFFNLFKALVISFKYDRISLDPFQVELVVTCELQKRVRESCFVYASGTLDLSFFSFG